MEEKGLFADSAPTGTISKHPLSELHDGDHEGPLTAAGKIPVVVSSPMGKDHPDHKPSVQKGGIKDQSMSGKGGSSYPKMSKSMGSGSEGSRAPKGGGRSIAKEMVYDAKKRAK